MVRFLTIWLLTAAVFLQSFAPLIVLVDFKIHQDFIAEVLCINRDEPELQCNGQCHLQDKLSEQQEQEQQAPNRAEEKIPLSFWKGYRLLYCITRMNTFWLICLTGTVCMPTFHPKTFSTRLR